MKVIGVHEGRLWDGNGVRVVPDYGCHKSTIKVDERGHTSSHSGEDEARANCGSRFRAS